jgi:hypothetical protein
MIPSMDNPSNSVPASQVIGEPAADASTWDGQQSYPDTCAIRCQEFILEQFTGQEIDETALVQEAANNGWYAPGQGTQLEDVGNVLEQHGVPVNRYEDATVHQLANELAQGHKVIIGVDSGELWQQNSVMESIADTLGIDGADHAVVVTGIDTSDPDNPQVIVSDPGTGEPAASYPLEQFVDAWGDSGFYMVATQDPAPSTLPEMANFDYELGHIPEIAGMSYEEFLTLADNPEEFERILDEYAQDMEEEADAEEDGAWEMDVVDPAMIQMDVVDGSAADDVIEADGEYDYVDDAYDLEGEAEGEEDGAEPGDEDGDTTGYESWM